MPDLAGVTARFAVALRAAGLATGPDRVARFTHAITLAAPQTVSQLRYCAHATLATTPADIAVLNRVFDTVFAGILDPASNRGGSDLPDSVSSRSRRATAAFTASAVDASPRGDEGEPDSEAPAPPLASATERLRHKDFSVLTPEELDLLAAAMASLRLSPPLRRSRRYQRSMTGPRLDLRTTLRLAQRFGGDPVRLV